MTDIEPSALHELPEDMEKVLKANAEVLEKWNSITPIARNEWICWTTIVKKEETRQDHIKRMQEDLLKGKKRPCCWPGCPHRNPKARKFFKNID
jgi:uncharacterized protein YdeI (YjbR/CyaY-like superfamily)